MTTEYSAEKKIANGETCAWAAATSTLLLRAAIEQGDIAACRAMLDKGADPNAPLSDLGTLFTYAISKGFTKGALLMLNFGASLEATTEAQISPLRCTSPRNDIVMCRELLSRGAVVDAADAIGGTALYMAARYSSSDVGKLLIEAGADIYSCDGNGLTAFHRSVVSRAPKAVEFVKLAISAGAHPDYVPAAPPHDYLTPFQEALKSGAHEVVAYLIDNYGDLLEKPTLDGRKLTEIVSRSNAPLLMAALTVRSVGERLDAAHDAPTQETSSEGFGPL
jgi:ankyrin repeat protein